MPAQPPPDSLLPWALQSLGLDSADATAPTVVAGDASSRRYFRAQLGGHSYVLVEAPPQTEKNDAFLAVRALLQDGGVRVPALLDADLARGYLLLEDLGDTLLLPRLAQGDA
ncbi:MAG: phosphotransferase, partial [Halioglobus sp.]|nr:phosphotransferase [Halioglobus sp.]